MGFRFSTVTIYEGPSEPVEDDSPVEEVEPVKAKRKYTRRRPTSSKKVNKEFVEPWTIEEEIALSHIGLDLNDEAADSEDVDVQEVAPMGRDLAKKKASSFGARSENFNCRKESSSEYLQIKERELKLEDQKRRELGELERLKIAQRDKELDLQQKMFEFQQQQKWEEDIKYYNEDHEHLTGRVLSTALNV
ncbi:hypothetical protein Tco_0132485 [Tanacetum coccineum]